MHINPLTLAALCILCVTIGYLKGKRDASSHALSMALQLSQVLDLHLSTLE